ncbi:hypothetical protein Noda2021_09220 [Candidatus Dependentiae bacterium Noda2021]|nr:hypothetical protein Noda2021_09220 [Candidatus Dependentiae bacterium Noda2021]
MKKILSLALASLALCASENAPLVTNKSLDTIVLDNVTLKKAGAKDASDYINLVSDINVSRYLLGAPITQEKIDAINKSTFKTKIMAPLVFALPEFLTRRLFHAGPRWMIKDQSDATIGSLSLATPPAEIKQFLISKGINSNHYDNLAITLKASEWKKGYAKETIFACLKRVFNNERYQNIKGIVLCFNKENTVALNRLLDSQTQQAKQPVVYQGEINLPKDFSNIAPEAFTAACFTISKNDFLHYTQTQEK